MHIGESVSLIELHRRLIAGDKKAAEIFVAQLLEPLQRRLPWNDQDHKYDAVTAALLDFIERPRTFDPAKGGIEAFLFLAAKRNLSNLCRGDRRRRFRETVAAQLQKNNVELGDSAGNSTTEEEDSAYRRLLAALNPVDRIVAELLRRGERQTTVFAAEMGLAGQPLEAQRLAVKRGKDRVKKAAQRLKGE